VDTNRAWEAIIKNMKHLATEAIRPTVVINVRYHFYKLHTKFYPVPSLVRPYIHEIIGIISVGFNVTDQQLIRFLHSSGTREKMGVQ
jgi:hypothetical protein